jgi:hypothetical protein
MKDHIFMDSTFALHNSELGYFSENNSHFTNPASPEEGFWQLQRISCEKEKALIKSITSEFPVYEICA